MTATSEETLKRAAQSFAHAQQEKSKDDHCHHSGNWVDVAKYLTHYGKPFKVKQHGEGTIYSLEICPFDASHVWESSIIQQTDGMLLFQCFHDSCRGRQWKDARAIISGNDSMASFMCDADTDQTTHATPLSEPALLVNDSPVNDWPEPPDDAAFYGLAGEFCQMIEPQTEADPVAILTQLLVAAGNVMGRRPFFSVEATRHHTNESLLLCGNTSKGRKGTSWEHDRRLLATADPEWATGCIKAGLVSGEGLIYHVRDANGDRDVGVCDKRLLVLEPEFAGILKVIARRDNSLSSTMRSAWDSGYLSTLAKNSPLKATDAHVSVISHVTQKELTRLLTETESANGFINRFLIICVRRSRILPEGGQPVDTTSVVDNLRKAVDFASSVREIKRDAKAREIWAAVYPHLTRDIPGISGAILSREAAHVVRLSLIYALLDRSREIKPPHLLAALALWEYVERSVNHIFGDRTGDPIADKIYDAAVNAGAEGITRTHIYVTLFQKHETREKIDCGINVLKVAGRVTIENIVTGGRPETRIIAILKKAARLCAHNTLNAQRGDQKGTLIEIAENTLSKGTYYGSLKINNNIIINSIQKECPSPVKEQPESPTCALSEESAISSTGEHTLPDGQFPYPEGTPAAKALAPELCDGVENPEHAKIAVTEKSSEVEATQYPIPQATPATQQKRKSGKGKQQKEAAGKAELPPQIQENFTLDLGDTPRSGTAPAYGPP